MLIILLDCTVAGKLLMGMAELTLKRGSGNGMVSSSFNEKTCGCRVLFGLQTRQSFFCKSDHTKKIIKQLRNYEEFLVLMYSTRKLSTATNQLSVRETVQAYIFANYSHMCLLAHICEYYNWKFHDLWKKIVGENSSSYI